MRTFLRSNGTWIAFIALAIVMALATKGDFLAARNLTNLMRQTAINGVLATGMTVIILTGGIDLSIGSIVALAGIFVGLSQVNWGWAELGTLGALQSLGLALGVGLLAGAVNGALISWLGVVPFVITLGMMVITRGLAMILSGGASISPLGDSLNSWAETYASLPVTLISLAVVAGVLLWQGRKNWPIFPLLVLAVFSYSFLTYRGMPYLVVFFALCFASVAFLLRYTAWGRSIYAIGSNEKAAYWAGVPIRRVVFVAYSLMGLLAGLAGVLLSARLNGADPNAGQLFELDAIAAVVIGGTSLKGGSGSVMGSLIGALVIATLNNGMDLLGVPSFYQMVFKGLIIIIAVALDRSEARSSL